MTPLTRCNRSVAHQNSASCCLPNTPSTSSTYLYSPTNTVAVRAFAVAKLSLQWVAKRGTEALLRYDDPKLLRAGVYRALGKARGGFLGDNDEKANIGRDLASYELEYSTLQGGVASLPSVVISLGRIGSREHARNGKVRYIGYIRDP